MNRAVTMENQNCELDRVSGFDGLGGDSSIIIGGVENFSLVDFPGHIAAAIFLKGCPWRCPFCYNTSLQSFSQDGEFDWELVRGFLKKRRGMLDAVVFSGGEPLAQANVINAVKEVKEMGYTIGLHTGGHYPKRLELILPYVDWVGFDIKAPLLQDRYKKAVGGITCIGNVLQSLDLLVNSRKNFEARTTCDPGILDIDDIYTIADFLYEKGVKNYHLQRYRQIEGDNTPDSECDKFFHDEDLKKYLIERFEQVEFRK